MDRLISEQAVLDAVSKACFELRGVFERCENAIKALPSAQPEIIRCRDCEYWDTSWQIDYASNYHYCPNVDGTRREDFYCADGERKANE